MKNIWLILFVLLSACSNEQNEQKIKNNRIVEDAYSSSYPNDFFSNSTIYDDQYGMLMAKNMEEYDLYLKPTTMDKNHEVHYEMFYCNYFDDIQINLLTASNVFLSIYTSRITQFPIETENFINYKDAETNLHQIKYGIASILINGTLIKDVIVTPVAAKKLSEPPGKVSGSPIFVRFEDNTTQKYADYVFWGSYIVKDILRYKLNYIDMPLVGMGLKTDNWKSMN